MIPVAGCDPGDKGALCWTRDGVHVERLRFKGRSIAEMRRELVNHYGPIACYFEQQGYRPSDAKRVASMMQFMRNTGLIEGALQILGYPIVYTKDWHYEFGLGGLECEEKKKAAHVIAQKLLPNERVTKDESDAILITIYGFRKENGGLTYGKQNIIARPGTGVVYTKRSPG
jgi:hypothetical protein